MGFVEGGGQGFPPNAGGASQGLVLPRPAEDAFVQGLPSVPAQPAGNENVPEVVSSEQSPSTDLPDSNRE